MFNNRSQSPDSSTDRLLPGSQSIPCQDASSEQTQDEPDVSPEEKKRPEMEASGAENQSPVVVELDAELVKSVALESPSISKERTFVRPEMSRETRAALKVLGDNLEKFGSNAPLATKLKNASNIVQHEWFKVSSTKEADPMAVEHFLDQLEQHSPDLLQHVVNFQDANGNTAMHYAVSYGNFDVVSILLDSKCCDVDRLNNPGYTPVMLAALAKLKNSTYASVVKRLFQMADVNVRAEQVSINSL